jgi:hypothetical protein
MSGHGSQAQAPILEQATHLASVRPLSSSRLLPQRSADTALLPQASLDYAKGLAGLGKDAGAKDVPAEGDKHGAESSHSLGGLINEGRNLTANIIHETAACVCLSLLRLPFFSPPILSHFPFFYRSLPPTSALSCLPRAPADLPRLCSLVGGAADKTKEAANDASKSVDAGEPKGYVAQARSLVGNVLEQAEGLIAAGEKKAEEASSDLKKKTDGAAADLQKSVEEAKANTSVRFSAFRLSPSVADRASPCRTPRRTLTSTPTPRRRTSVRAAHPSAPSSTSKALSPPSNVVPILL